MEAKILKGPRSKHQKITKSVGEFFFEQAKKLNDKVCQIDADSGKQETYQEVKRRSTKVAISLRKLGLQENDVVMVCCQNNLNDIIPVLATLYLGGCISSIDPKESINDVKHALDVVKPKFVFVEQESLTLVEESLKCMSFHPKIFVIGHSTKYVKMADMESQTNEEDSFEPVKKDIHDTAVIVFSSGTTSLPKGISISHFAVLHGFLCLVYEMDNCKPDVMIHFASLFWISAILLTGISLVTGGTKVIAPKISAEALLGIIEKYKVSFIFMSNTYTYEITSLLPETIKKYDTSSLYSIIIGGSTMNPVQLKKCREMLPKTKITVGYGSSESAAVSAFDIRDENAYVEKMLSSGRIVSDVEVKITDLETGDILPPNKEGEILVKSPYLMKGYYNLKKLDTYDQDGFLRTGDVGYYDEDEYLYVTDRINEMFKFQTYQISPITIERALLEHPLIEEAIVFGVPHEVDRFHPGACVVLKRNCVVSEEDILKFVDEKVSDKNRLRAGVKIVSKIPRTPTGKVQRRTVRDFFINGVNLGEKK